MSALSDEAQLMVHPFAGYASLARRGTGSLLERCIVVGVVLGGFVSFTAAGRLVLVHFVSPWFFSAHFVVLPCGIAALLARGFAPTVRTRDALSLYLAGAGPWLLFLVLWSALCVFFPDPGATFRALLFRGVPFYALLVTLGWGVVLTFAFFRTGLALGSRRALLATASFYVALVACVLGWFLFTGQLLPIFR